MPCESPLCSFRHIGGESVPAALIDDQEAAASMDLIRAASLETLRDIVFLWTTPF